MHSQPARMGFSPGGMHRERDVLLSRETDGRALTAKVWLVEVKPSFRRKRPGAIACPGGLVTTEFVCKKSTVAGNGQRADTGDVSGWREEQLGRRHGVISQVCR